jgi:uncharacterized repeat protein (TIGR01451 family)
MRLIAAALACSALAAALSAHATIVPAESSWTESVWATNDFAHTGLAWAPDGSDRLFVLEKGGEVRVLSGSLAGTPVWTTFATMSPIFTNSECGLIGMAFDPDFVNNHYVYFFVSVSNSEQQIIRYDASTNTGSGRTVIKGQLPTVGNNHDGGGIGFAADGKLYWAVGDLGNGTGVDANLTSLASKVGRANRDGSLPTGNPFDDGAGPNNDFIFARGMRNPFTMQIQPSTGQIWLNVVGDNYEQIFVVGSGDHGGYNDFENNQPAPNVSNQYITPKIVYPTSTGIVNLALAAAPNGAARSSGVATFTTTGNHRLRVGSTVEIVGVTDTSFNGADQVVASTPSNTTFTLQQAGPNATSGGGNARPLIQGRCLTGGAFYDATLAPAQYRGNFFYGDCVSNRIMRARIDESTNQVLGVSYFATGIANQVDIALGPDGALYYVGGGTNQIFRAAYTAPAQALVVANRFLRADEGGDVVTSVSLAVAPVANVVVNVARTAGDSDVSVAAGATLTFTPSNWDVPQTVRFQAATDADAIDDAATISVTSSGLATEQVQVTVLDLLSGAIADLSVTKTDGVTSAIPGNSVTYMIMAANVGPDGAVGATVQDTFPPSLTCTWTCSNAGGGTCTANGSGNINDVVNLPVGTSITYTAICAIAPSATGTLSNTALVNAPAAVGDNVPGNNSSTDNNTVLVPTANLSITKTDGATSVAAGGSTTYTIVASNAGPSHAPGSTVADTFPIGLSCTWTCVGASGGTCTAGSSGNINDVVNLPAGGSVTYTAVCAIDAGASGTLTNTATVTVGGSVSDPAPGNNSDTDQSTVSTTLIFADGFEN